METGSYLILAKTVGGETLKSTHRQITGCIRWTSSMLTTSTARKRHIYTPLRDVCVQYENNPANAFKNIVRKLNLSSAIN